MAAEAKQQAASLLDTVRTEVGPQAGTQQNRIAEALHGLSKELGGMASSSRGVRAVDRSGAPGLPQGRRDRALAAGPGAGRCVGVGPLLRPPASGHLPGPVRSGRDGRRTAHPQHGGDPDQPGHQGRRRLRHAPGGCAAPTSPSRAVTPTPVVEPAPASTGVYGGVGRDHRPRTTPVTPPTRTATAPADRAPADSRPPVPGSSRW